jgi:hypothetical protein
MLKTWEMIKALTENDNLRFKAQDGMTAEVAVNGCLVLKDSDGDEAEVRIVSGVADIEPDKWDLIPQEVTWQEAIQAWIDESKGFHVDLVNNGTIYQSGLQILRGFDTTHFHHGKWFID